MTTSRRWQQRYDHRLRELVRDTGNVTIATDLGVPRSTARGWLRKAPAVVVSLDVTKLKTSELQQEIVALRFEQRIVAERLEQAGHRPCGFRLIRRYGRYLRLIDRTPRVWCHALESE